MRRGVWRRVRLFGRALNEARAGEEEERNLLKPAGEGGGVLKPRTYLDPGVQLARAYLKGSVEMPLQIPRPQPMVPSVDHPRTTAPFVFVNVAAHDGQRAHQIPRMTCAGCGAVADQMPVYGRAMASNLIMKFRRMGWTTDGRHARKTFCPTCSTPKRLNGKTPEVIEQPKEKTPVPETTTNGVAPPSAKFAPTEPTPNQRANIRRLLDANFDDAKGFYLDGYSDQRIGTEVGVPWAVVKQLREAAYGPIKSDPAVETLLGAVAQASADAADIARSLVAARQQIDLIAKRQEVTRITLDRLARDAAELKSRYKL